MSRRAQDPVRRASHAGSWYSDNPTELASEVEGTSEVISRTQQNTTPDNMDEGRAENFKKAKCPPSIQGRDDVTVKAIIGPHAGYRFCGHIMASAYSALKGRAHKQNIRRVILFGPSHHVYTDKCALPTAKEHQTPLGSLQVDQGLKEELASKAEFDTFPVGAEEDEHSLEMHLPYIVNVFGTDISFLPVVVGALDDKTEEYYGKVFADYFKDPETVFLISSDFCHWGKKFRYMRYNEEDGEIWESIQKLDQDSMECIKTLVPENFREYLSKTGNTICGRHPILLMMEVVNQCKRNEYTAEFFDYDQSNRANSKNDMSVSYGAGVVWTR